jgi:hypothetical protein
MGDVIRERPRHDDVRTRRGGDNGGQRLAVEVVEVVMGAEDGVDAARLVRSEGRRYEAVGMWR